MSDKRIGNGRDAKTGKFLPGNPGGGRPPMPEALKQLYQAEAASALWIAGRLMRDKTQPGAVRLRACEYITDRGYGKPTQPVDATIANITDEELLRRARLRLAELEQAQLTDGS